jgi:D-alanine-D-alanine ligase
VVFPVLHGPWGEDGTVQGLLETLGVPYVGSGVLSSAVAMDKGFMKAALASAGLDVGRYVVVSDREWRADAERVLADVADLGFPVFVKPARAGSSLGIVRVTEAGALRDAIEGARKHDPRVIVEAAVAPAREIECGVLVDADEQPRASRCAEIIVNARHEFYDFEAKYLDDSATLVVPADLPSGVEDRVRYLAVRAFDALDCDGLARVDFFVRDTGEVVVNEVNTMPGFTSISLYPRMWGAAGIDYPELVDRLVADALRKGTGLH